MSEREILLTVQSRHDQDEAAGRDWFASLSGAEKAVFWALLDQKFDNDLLDAMSRLAMLQFERFLLDQAAREGDLISRPVAEDLDD